MRWETTTSDRAARLVYQGPDLVVGEFHCAPDDPRWTRENDIGPGAHVVFPGTSVLIQHAGAEPVVANPNHVMFYNEHQTFRRRLLSQRGDRSVFLIPQPELLAQLATGTDEQGDDVTAGPKAGQAGGAAVRFAVSHAPVDPRTYLLQRMVIRHLSARPADRFAVQEACLRILARAVTNAFRPRQDQARRRRGTAKAHAALVEATKASLCERFALPLTLEDIARTVHASPFHLARVFRDRTGSSIHRYRDQLRLRSSLDRLWDSNGDLSGLALDLGYSSHSHFTGSFRRAFGSSPSEVRRSAGAADVRGMRTMMEAAVDRPA